MINYNFAVFILTHGRPNKVTTYHTLRRCGYTGDIYIIVDDEDSTVNQYKSIYGGKVIVFSKSAIAETFDEAGIFEDRRAVVYARNASFQIARDLGLDYFLQLDDDYDVFRYRFSSEFIPITKNYLTKNLDKLFDLFLSYYESIPALSIAMGQGGDFLGGVRGGYSKKIFIKRKAMNTFFCSVKRPFQFLGRINEDVNTYTRLGYLGNLFLSVLSIYVDQNRTQQNAGGMTALYLNSGTYIKSFYTVMFCPSFVTVEMMKSHHKRYHHKINWNNAVPKILNEKYRKLSNDSEL